MSIFDVGASSLFVSATSQRAQMANIAQRVLSNALEHFVAKRYDEAITGFKQAVGLAPQSDTAINAYDYLARIYYQQGNSAAAVNAYEQAIKIDPGRADTHVTLGNLYISMSEPDKAVLAYEKAVVNDPSGVNRYSLGQAFLESGRYSEAVGQFTLVRDQEPGKPNGWYGLGLAYVKQGQASDAIDAFQQALSIQQDFSYAKVELGYLLADTGERDLATQIATELQTSASDLAETLSQYIFEKTPAEMVGVLATSTFPKVLGPRTQVSALSSYLVNAGDQQTFSMIFQFNKPMDAQSVENILNWSISRSTDTGRADGYNFGFAVPDTEVTLSGIPSSVTYDPTLYAATVLFTLRQNDTANGTLDPSHIKFAFEGTDAGGLAISRDADEYTGFSGVA